MVEGLSLTELPRLDHTPVLSCPVPCSSSSSPPSSCWPCYSSPCAWPSPPAGNPHCSSQPESGGVRNNKILPEMSIHLFDSRDTWTALCWWLESGSQSRFWHPLLFWKTLTSLLPPWPQSQPQSRPLLCSSVSFSYFSSYPTPSCHSPW